jgi:cytochrome b561
MNSLSNTGSSYGPISKFFHWVIGVLVILMLFTYFLDDIPNKILKGVAFNAHKLTGLTILSLMVLRLIWTLCNPKPTLPNTKLWERCLEHLVHWSLYLALFLMPIAGWIGVSAGGHGPRLGMHDLSLPIDKSEKLSDLAFSVHNTLAIIIIVLVSLHVLAAAFHYFVKKDNVFQRMWP